MLRVCFLTHNLKHDNGAGVFSRRLIEGMSKSLPCESIALTTEKSGMSYEQPILYPNIFKLLFHFFRIRKIIKECELVHALDAFPYGVIATVVSLGLRKKIIITAVGTGAVNALYKLGFKQILSWTYRRANRVIAVSHFTMREIKNVLPHLKIEVITHGVDLEMVKNNNELPSERVAKYKPYILSVGSLRWRKGYKLSIRAFSELAHSFPEIKYVVVGKRYSSSYYRTLQQLIKELKLESKVFILDAVDDPAELWEIYRNAELFLLMSQNILHDVEGFGLVFLEAAAAGLPVVGSKDCGVEDAMRDGKNGFLIDGRDLSDAVSAIKKILSDRALHKSMSIESCRLASQTTWDKKVLEYKEIYQHVARL